eukprot:1763273-Pyramimonas_sp.AAC.1
MGRERLEERKLRAAFQELGSPQELAREVLEMATSGGGFLVRSGADPALCDVIDDLHDGAWTTVSKQPVTYNATA